MRYYWQPAMYDQAFLSLLFNKNLWRNLNIKQRSGMRPVRRLSSWLQKERSLSSCIKILSITLTMSSRSRNIVSLSYESEYKRKKSDSLMLGGLQRMISFFIFVYKMKNLRKKLKPGDKVWCFWEKNSYKVIWRNKRFIIIAKPFYAIKNFIYSIIDLQQGRMWPDNRLFGWYDYLKREYAERAIKDLESWDLEISERRGCRLVVPDRIQKQRR